MKLVNIETFLAVASLRHFRKAAEHLNTTQPNVSARIAELERLVGGPLFTRTNRGGTTLSPLGLHMVPYAERIIESVNKFSAQTKVEAMEKGKLRLALSETMVMTLLQPFLENYCDRYPNVAVDITVESTTNMRQMLIDRAIDIAFLMGPISEYEVTNKKLITLPLIWVASPGHPSLLNDALELSDLSKWPIITYAANSRPYLELKNSFREASIVTPRLFTSNSLNATLAMTMSGIGISTLPEIFAKPHLESGKIVALKTQMPVASLSFTASFTSEPMNTLSRSAANIATSLAQSLNY